MKYYKALILAALITGCGNGDLTMLEFVESIPKETSLDNSDIRNTADVWLEMIKSAERSIDLSHFYISPGDGDDLLHKVIAELEAAASRGITVRFLIDAGMYRTYPETADLLNAMGNIEVRKIDLRKLSGGILHTKYMIIDGRDVFLGSQNFDWRALEHIHEFGIRVRNSDIAAFYEDIFNLDWSLAEDGADSEKILSGLSVTDEMLSYTVNTETWGQAELIPGASYPGILPFRGNADENILTELISSSENRIVIQLLSFGTHSREGSYTVLLDALKDAAARGVQVDIILADWGKRPGRIDEIKDLNAEKGIRVYLSSIPEYSGGYISFARVEHCKYMSIDDKILWVGSSNWSESYFRKSRNVSLTVKNEALSRRLREVFEKSLNSGYCEVVDNSREYEVKEYGERE